MTEYQKTIELNGNSYGFISTGIEVEMNDNISVKANGIILFASNVPFSNGYPRDPDGKDEGGKQEWPAKKYGNGHPAPDHIKNSLVLRINGVLIQGGTQISFKSPSSGTIEVTNNDNDCTDNKKSWSITISKQSTLQTYNRGNICVVQDPSGNVLIEKGTNGIRTKFELATKAFIQKNGNNFDFITFLHDPSLYNNMGDPYSIRIYNDDIKGIGNFSPSDEWKKYGTNKKLGSIHVLTNETMEKSVPEIIRTLLHEFSHHWGVYANYKEHLSGQSQNIHLAHNIHWNGMTANAGRSPLVFQNTNIEWVRTSDSDIYEAKFIPLSDMVYFNDLDLYFMGYLNPTQVQPITIFVESKIISQSPTIKIRVTKSIQISPKNFIWECGERDPKSEKSQKDWRHGFVILTKDSQVSEKLFNKFNDIRIQFEKAFRQATRQLGTVNTSL